MIASPRRVEVPDEPSSLRLALTLGVAGLLSGVVLVGVYELTLPMIEANKAAALRAAVFEVVPGSTSMRKLVEREGALVPAGDEASAEVFAAYDAEGAFAGYAIAGEGAGFQDTIRLIYGFDPGGRRIVGMRVLESRETPGLGDKIIKDPAFVGAFDDLAVAPRVTLVKPGERDAPHEVDAITGATISSRAVVKIVQDANERWLERLPAAPPPREGGDG